MLDSLLNAWDRWDDTRDRVADVRKRFRDGWNARKLMLVLIVGWVAFLLVEEMWKTLTLRNAPRPALEQDHAPIDSASR